jgi:hypothetical protein
MLSATLAKQQESWSAIRIRRLVPGSGSPPADPVGLLFDEVGEYLAFEGTQYGSLMPMAALASSSVGSGASG